MKDEEKISLLMLIMLVLIYSGGLLIVLYVMNLIFLFLKGMF